MLKRYAIIRKLDNGTIRVLDSYDDYESAAKALVEMTETLIGSQIAEVEIMLVDGLKELTG